ncbi:hypothetical protein [Ensifer sp.]|jgi:hypothetical protein|uniref:hypothetical protein n=1 Tax=Ensifer sp. TaxID=1872086 RepID=UPI002E12E2AE|nr:hypothetical protein [Ensifer sp.]
MPAPQVQIQIDDDGQPIDEAAVAVAWHAGDKDATIRTLLDDCRHLRQQLTRAEGSMSVGFARGWRPNLERPVDET